MEPNQGKHTKCPGNAKMNEDDKMEKKNKCKG